MAKKVIPLKKKKKKRIGLKLFLLLILVLAGLFALLYFKQIESIDIVGESRYKDSEILEMVEINEGMSVFNSYLKKRNKTKLLPFLDSVEIKYTALTKMNIIVKSKEICSLIPFQERYLALDKNGYVLGYEKKRKTGVPVSLGINLKEAIIGEKVDLEDEMINSILDIYFSAKKNDLSVNEISFVGGKTDNIHIYMGEIDILLGAPDNMDRKLATAKTVLNQIPSSSKGLLDLSSESDKYIFKNDYELRFYLKEKRGFAAVDNDYIIKKISMSKFVDAISINNLLDYVGEIEEPVQLSEEQKALLENIIKLSEDNSLVLRTIDFKYENKNELVLEIDGINFNFKNSDDLESKFLAVSDFLNSEDKSQIEAENEDENLSEMAESVKTYAVLNKNIDKYTILIEK